MAGLGVDRRERNACQPAKERRNATRTPKSLSFFLFLSLDVQVNPLDWFTLQRERLQAPVDPDSVKRERKRYRVRFAKFLVLDIKSECEALSGTGQRNCELRSFTLASLRDWLSQGLPFHTLSLSLFLDWPGHEVSILWIIGQSEEQIERENTVWNGEALAPFSFPYSRPCFSTKSLTWPRMKRK